MFAKYYKGEEAGFPVYELTRREMYLTNRAISGVA